MGEPPVPIYKWDFPANHPAIGVPLLVGTPPYIGIYTLLYVYLRNIFPVKSPRCRVGIGLVASPIDKARGILILMWPCTKI